MVFWKLSPHLAGAFVGKNKYKTRTQALATEFKRQQPKLWKEAMEALKAKTTAEETGELVLKDNPELIAACQSAVTESTKEAREAFQKRVSEVVATIPCEKKRKAAEDAARKRVYTSTGIQNESESLHTWFREQETEAGVFDDLVDARNKTPWFKLKLRGGGMYGKVDGIFTLDSGEQIVVEGKERQNRLLGETEYERVQVFVYMKMLNVTRGMIVETFQRQTKRYHVFWNDEEWNDYEIKLNKCIFDLNRAFCDINYRKELVKSLL